MRVFCASAADLELEWPRFLPHLVQFERATHAASAMQIFQGIREDRNQLWGLQDEKDVQGVCVTEVLETPRGRICLILAACGHASKAARRMLWDRIKAWAKEIGCVAVRVCGRIGWLKVFPELHMTGVILECAL